MFAEQTFCVNGIIRNARAVEAAGHMTKALGGASMKEIISGIYVIRNKVNGHKYIGSSCNIHSRWQGHLRDLLGSRHHALPLQRSWNKWSKESFEFSIIEQCDKSQLAEREQYFIDTMRSEYKVCQRAHSCSGLIRSPETRANMSAARQAYLLKQKQQKENENGG